MQEISAICTRIMVIKDGRLVANGSPRELMSSTTGGAVFRVRIEGPPDSGTPPLFLRDVRPFVTRLNAFREPTLSRTKDYLAAVAEAASKLISAMPTLRPAVT